MLTKFAVTNYRGFKDRIEWDLSHPSNYEFNPHVIKDGVVKNGIVYGPNGSGKTNFSLALFDIENHLSQKWKKQDYYQNFIYAGRENLTVDFEYTFRFGKDLIQYDYSKNVAGLLVSEKLNVNGSDIFKKGVGTFEMYSPLFPVGPSVEENIKANANNISIINYLLASYPLNADNYLIKLQQFVGSMLWFRNLDVREIIGGLDNSVTMLDEYIISNNLLNDFAVFLEEVSEQKFKLVSDQTGKQLFCKINNVLVPFYIIASTGTQSLRLLYFWMQKMKDLASFVFIDEFDAFYHFKLAFEVCRRLFSLNCQVFTSSHNTYLMTNDLLRPDCNFILNNNKIKPLNECTDKELRFGHNIEKLFRGGTFEI